jgi:hypothetical protein
MSTSPPVPGPLSPADDLPIHQIAEPIAVVGTSDRHFYDRYYFFGHHCSDEVAITAGLGQYPNLGVADGFVAVTQGGRQEVLRCSRELDADRTQLSVGPLSVSVLEGLRRLDLLIAPNDHGIDGVLHWEGVIPAHLEPRHVNRTGPRLTTDSVRFCQTGRWRGHLSVDGQRLDLGDAAWWGGRDRSWGIRPVGEPEPPSRRFAPDSPGFLWIYGMMQFADHTIVAMVQEDGAGRRTLDYGARVWNDGRPAELLGSLTHELEIDPETRQIGAATLGFADSKLSVEVTPMAASFLALGTGYGTEPGWRHGMYQGRLEIQRRGFDLADPAVRRHAYGLVDAVARYTTAGSDGYGLFEYAVLGSNQRYGLRPRRRPPEQERQQT